MTDLGEKIDAVLRPYVDPDDGTVPIWHGRPGVPVWVPVVDLRNDLMAKVEPALAAAAQSARNCSCDGDPIECAHEAALGEAEEKARRQQTKIGQLHQIVDRVDEMLIRERAAHKETAERADKANTALVEMTALRDSYERDRNLWRTANGDLREQHDVHRKALADALGTGWHPSWEQLTARVATERANLARQRDKAEADLAEMTRCRDSALRAAAHADQSIDVDLEGLIGDGLADAGVEWEDGENGNAPRWFENLLTDLVRPVIAHAVKRAETAEAALGLQAAETDRLRKVDANAGKLITRLKAETHRLTSFLEREYDQHMRFWLLHEDGPAELMPCADWCFRCKLDRANGRADTAEARLAELENALTWGTTCTGCARRLDASISEYERVRTAIDKAREYGWSLKKTERAVLAALTQPEGDPRV